MSVQVSCKSGQNLLATQLDVSAGEHLIYELTFKGAQAVFAVTDQHGVLILSPADGPSGPGAFRKKWPAKKSDVKIPDDLNHVLGLHFIGAVEYGYRVTRHAGDGTVVAVCKNCTYGSTTPTDSWFSPLRIFTV